VRAVDTRGGRAANQAKSLHKSRLVVSSISVRSILNLAGYVCEHSGSLVVVREKRYHLNLLRRSDTSYVVRLPADHSGRAAARPPSTARQPNEDNMPAPRHRIPLTGIAYSINHYSEHDSEPPSNLPSIRDPRHSAQPQDPARDPVARGHELAPRIAARPFGLRARAAAGTAFILSRTTVLLR